MKDNRLNLIFNNKSTENHDYIRSLVGYKKIEKEFMIIDSNIYNIYANDYNVYFFYCYYDKTYASNFAFMDNKWELLFFDDNYDFSWELFDRFIDIINTKYKRTIFKKLTKLKQYRPNK